MWRTPLPTRLLVPALRSVAVLGLVAALLGLVVGWGLLTQAGTALEQSLVLTGDTLEALDASAGVAADSVEVLGTSLAGLRDTADALDTAFADGEVLLTDLGELIRRDVAESVQAIDAALPGLIRVASTIDTTLSALSSLPFGPAYDPSESFADALRTLGVSLDGLPEQLQEQATLIESSAASLGDVGDGVGDLVEDLSAFDATLADTAELLDTYETTITEGSALVEEAADGFGRQIGLGRVVVVLFCLAFAGLQLVPLHLAAVAATAAPATTGPTAGPTASPTDRARP